MIYELHTDTSCESLACAVGGEARTDAREAHTATSALGQQHAHRTQRAVRDRRQGGSRGVSARSDHRTDRAQLSACGGGALAKVMTVSSESKISSPTKAIEIALSTCSTGRIGLGRG